MKPQAASLILGLGLLALSVALILHVKQTAEAFEKLADDVADLSSRNGTRQPRKRQPRPATTLGADVTAPPAEPPPAA